MGSVFFTGRYATLYLGDVLALTPPAHDCLLSDPPYGVEFESGRASGKWGVMNGDGSDRTYVVTRLAHALGGLRRGRHVYLFGPRPEGLKICGWTELIWDKVTFGMGNLTVPWGPQHETIHFGTYELSVANREKGYGNLSARIRKGSILRCQKPQSARVNRHPTEKPTDILRQMIESSTVLGETVFDPFSGSGSTLVAALLSGRKAVGVEIDERYAETAAKRLEACERALDALGACDI